MYRVQKAVVYSVTFFLIFVVGFAVVMALLALFGIRLYTIESGSMEPALMTGDAVLVDTNTKSENVEVGDVIVYDRDGESIIHRVVGVSDDSWVLKGDANIRPDTKPVYEWQLVGKELCVVPVLGKVVMATRNPKFSGLMAATFAALGYLIMAYYSSQKRPKEDDDES